MGRCTGMCVCIQCVYVGGSGCVRQFRSQLTNCLSAYLPVCLSVCLPTVPPLSSSAVRRTSKKYSVFDNDASFSKDSGMSRVSVKVFLCPAAQPVFALWRIARKASRFPYNAVLLSYYAMVSHALSLSCRVFSAGRSQPTQEVITEDYHTCGVTDCEVS